MTNFLISEHHVLRAQLTLIERALRIAPESYAMLRELCASLTHMLDEHAQRETRAVETSTIRLPATAQYLHYRLAQEWLDLRAVLRDVNTQLWDELTAPADLLVPRLRHVIASLRDHMIEEERHVFPWLDRPGRGAVHHAAALT